MMEEKCINCNNKTNLGHCKTTGCIKQEIMQDKDKTMGISYMELYHIEQRKNKQLEKDNLSLKEEIKVLHKVIDIKDGILVMLFEKIGWKK